MMEMTANGRLPGRPVTGSVAGPAQASPEPIRTGRMDLSAQQSAPYWARRFARRFLGHCHDITTETAENAELLVSELVTNAYQATGIPAGLEATYSRLADAPVITLSLRHFPAVLLIEVIDSSPLMPHLEDSGAGDEHGRGLMLTEALSADWGYFPGPQYGKCVYCILRTAG
jgi:anti-sigma regulatory factor (Ser/Thr protein kinase)